MWCACRVASRFSAAAAAVAALGLRRLEAGKPSVTYSVLVLPSFSAAQSVFSSLSSSGSFFGNLTHIPDSFGCEGGARPAAPRLAMQWSSVLASINDVAGEQAKTSGTVALARTDTLPTG